MRTARSVFDSLAYRLFLKSISLSTHVQMGFEWERAVNNLRKNDPWLSNKLNLSYTQTGLLRYGTSFNRVCAIISHHLRIHSTACMAFPCSFRLAEGREGRMLKAHNLCMRNGKHSQRWLIMPVSFQYFLLCIFFYSVLTLSRLLSLWFLNSSEYPFQYVIILGSHLPVEQSVWLLYRNSQKTQHKMERIAVTCLCIRGLDENFKS